LNPASPDCEARNNPLNHDIHGIFDAALKNTVVSMKWIVLVVVYIYAFADSF
jgi:hypothetical protein